MKIKKILGYYGLILFAINALALFLTSSLVSNVLTDTKVLNIMNEFIANRKNLNFILETIPFTVPFLFCFAYTKKLVESNNIQQRKKLLVNWEIVMSSATKDFIRRF